MLTGQQIRVSNMLLNRWCFDNQRYRPFPAHIPEDTMDAMWKFLCEDRLRSPCSDEEKRSVEQMLVLGVNGILQVPIHDWKFVERLALIPRCFRLV